jgi:ABC-2 type transport system permease protein
MPLHPAEIVLAKVWATGLVIIMATLLCYGVVLRWALEIPIAGSIGVFVFGTALYLFSMTAIGIFLATLARSMPQFGLLAIPLFIIINLLSGGTTPLEGMPEALQMVMATAPSTHYVSFAQAILFRDASLAVVWRELTAFTLIGAAFFAGALLRFRATIAAAHA